MKDCVLCGVLFGMVAGILLYKHSNEAKNIVNKTEEMVKKELKTKLDTQKG